MLECDGDPEPELKTQEAAGSKLVVEEGAVLPACTSCSPCRQTSASMAAAVFCLGAGRLVPTGLDGFLCFVS